MLTSTLLQQDGEVKIVGRLVHVQVLGSTQVKLQQPKNVVNPQEITNWFVSVPLAMVGVEVILNLADKNIAKDSRMGMSKKKRQPWLKVIPMCS